jgi:hypothetical protein
MPCFIHLFLAKVLLSVSLLTLVALACALPAIPGLGSPSDGSLYRDDFSDSNSGWNTGTAADRTVEYGDGGLKMDVFTPNNFVYSMPNAEDYQNVHIEVTAQNNSTDPTVGFGILCNQQVTKSAFYYFGIQPDGVYAIAKAAVAKDDELLAYGTSDLIQQNASSYRLGADCGSGTLTLYVNGQKIDSASDTTYAKGIVGLFTASGDQSSGSNLVYDDFVITPLQ